MTTTNTYDADNRLLSTSYSDGATPPVSYAYDADGRRVSMTDGTGTTTYDYDSLGRKTRTLRDGVVLVIGGYDLAGNRTSMQYPNGHTVTMQYDGNGQMTGVTDWLGNTTTFQYADDASLLGLKVYDANKAYTVGDTAIYNTSLFRNAANQIIHIRARDVYGNAVASFDYTRAADGRITSVHTTGLGQPDQSYGYDAKGRLGSENGNLVSFDSRNNVTRLPDGSTLDYDAADQLRQISTADGPRYQVADNNGRRISDTSPQRPWATGGVAPAT